MTYSRITVKESTRCPDMEGSLRKGLVEFTRENYGCSWKDTQDVLFKVALWNKRLVSEILPAVERQALGVVEKRGLPSDCVMIKKLMELKKLTA